MNNAIASIQVGNDGLEKISASTRASEEAEVDKDELVALVEEAKGYDKDDYTEASFATLFEVLGDAKDVLSDEDATQEDVDDASESLQAAIDGLEKISEPTPEPEEPEVDKDELEALVEEAKGYDEDDYTEKSFATLSAALGDAEDVLSDEDATQEDVDNALASLQAAIDGLGAVVVVDPDPEPTPKPEDPEVDKEDLKALI